ncbi:MAG: hypothetical protein JEZ09_12850 [Salinivirgaceae bacterium]|nr:hypothetical protein [Salinivirgaceae bacterium]
MDTSLYDSMKNENNENLFSYFKHDGSYNFQKKIVAGKILKERNYNKSKLIAEKEKIVKSLKKDIGRFFDNGELKLKHKLKSRKQMMFVLIATFCLMSANLIYIIIHDGFNQAFWIEYSIFCAVILAFVLYKVIEFNKSLSTKDKVVENFYKQYKIRLKTINREWKF